MKNLEFYLLFESINVLHRKFINAIVKSDVEVVRAALTAGRVDPGANDNVAIQVASEIGNLEIFKMLIVDDRVDIVANNNMSIFIASKKGNLDIVRELLHAERVDPSARNNSAIHWASVNKHFEVVAELLAQDRVVRKFEYRTMSEVIKRELKKMYAYINTDEDIKMMIEMI